MQDSNPRTDNLKLFVTSSFCVFVGIIEEGGGFDCIDETKEVAKNRVVVGSEGN